MVYEWRPVQCSHYQGIGHNVLECKQKKQMVQTRQKWVPKKKKQVIEADGFQQVAGPSIPIQHIHVPVVVENAFAALQDGEETLHHKGVDEGSHEMGIHGEEGEPPTMNG
ncbi:uncharacterized protein LOC104893979 [Beta vulgaris subsp. vulgaris]|uniref:uncharacterized protein LOC104893979 n=1 Tax=Beta vulgaris subsp. vulgaris TaxID=3555 RepID=UPI0005400505|nr:uncharacterized protein LOC104893979 [Beta vulgaris subsp. vulgaris]